MMKAFTLLAMIPFALAGCGAEQYLRQTNGVDVTAAYNLTNEDVVEQIDLGSLLMTYAPKVDDPKGFCERAVEEVLTFEKPRSLGTGTSTSSDSIAAYDPASGRKLLDRGLAFFNCRVGMVTDPERRAARNALQERLLAASQQRCAAFSANLQRTFARTNFGLGIITTVAGAAGALSNSLTAARNWAGTSGVFSGARAEFNQDYMANLAAHVVVDGIEKRRVNVYDQIQKQGQSKEYSAYPVEAAIKDAFFYHGECSVVAGFQQASDAIKYSNDPGLNASIQTLAKIRAARVLWTDDTVKPDDVLALGAKIVTASPLSAGSALKGQDPSGQYLQRFQVALQNIYDADTVLNDTAQDMNKQAEAKQPGLAAKLKIPAGLKNTSDVDNAFGTVCKKVVESAWTGEQLARAVAETERNVTAKRDLAVEAASRRAWGMAIADQAATIASDYEATVSTSTKAWRKVFAMALGGDNAAQKDLGALFAAAKLPGLDRSGTTAIQQLCAEKGN